MDIDLQRERERESTNHHVHLPPSRRRSRVKLLRNTWHWEGLTSGRMEKEVGADDEQPLSIECPLESRPLRLEKPLNDASSNVSMLVPALDQAYATGTRVSSTIFHEFHLPNPPSFLSSPLPHSNRESSTDGWKEIRRNYMFPYSRMMNDREMERRKRRKRRNCLSNFISLDG